MMILRHSVEASLEISGAMGLVRLGSVKVVHLPSWHIPRGVDKGLGGNEGADREVRGRFSQGLFIFVTKLVANDTGEARSTERVIPFEDGDKVKAVTFKERRGILRNTVDPDPTRGDEGAGHIPG